MSQGDQWALGAVAFANQGINPYQSQYGGAIEQQLRAAQLQRLQQICVPRNPMIEGNKPTVVCGTIAESCKDMDEAQRKAEELAHKHDCNAYILKPVRMVAPKRDVVTTDL